MDTRLLNAVVDLSHHNTVTSFEEARRSGIIGVIHKATEGTTFIDAKYSERRAQALSSGLLWGAYHFGVRGNAEAQVRHFLETVAPAPSDLLVLDFEANSREGTMSVGQAESFVELCHQQLDRTIGLYSGQAFLIEQMRRRQDSSLTTCFLWLARYGHARPELPKGFGRLTLWQYTDGSAGPQPHQVPGIGRCDRDKFNGTEDELRSLWTVQ